MLNLHLTNTTCTLAISGGGIKNQFDFFKGILKNSGIYPTKDLNFEDFPD